MKHVKTSEILKLIWRNWHCDFSTQVHISVSTQFQQSYHVFLVITEYPIDVLLVLKSQQNIFRTSDTHWHDIIGKMHGSNANVIIMVKMSKYWPET